MNALKKYGFSGLIALSAISILTMLLWFLIGHHFKTPHSFGNDSFSRSALGHSVFLEALERAGHTVERSKFQTSTQLQNVDLVILAEPYIQPKTTERTDEARQVLASGKPTLLVAPKRWGSPASLEDKHIARQGLEETTDVKYAVETLLQVDSTVTRTEATDCGDVTILDAQFVASDGFRPTGPCPAILTHRDHIWVLSDPDIIANHMLDSQDAQELALSIVNNIAGPNATILVDETVHGHIQRPSLGELLTEPPLVWVVIHFFILFLFAGWAGLGRFGPGLAPLGPQEPGKALLIQNTSELLSYSGHQGLILKRYWEMMISDLKNHFQLTGNEAEVLQSLDKIIHARGLDWQIHALKERVDSLSDLRTSRPSRKITSTVRSIFQMRSQLIQAQHRNPS